jgi:outer membrane biosynthesis protein TonB
MAKRVQRIKRATSASTTKKKPTKKATTRSQVQAKKKAAAKKATPKKPSNRMVVKPKKKSTRKPKVVAKPLQGKDLGGTNQAKVQQAKATPKTPLRGKDLGGAKQAKMQQSKSGSSVKPAATASGRKAQVGRLLKQGMKRAGILGLGFAAADFAGLTPELTSRDARMGRRTKKVQQEAAEKKVNTPKVKGLKKETVKPKKKPVNIGNVSKKAAPAKKPMAKKAVPNPVPKNVVRSGSGAPVRTGSGGYLRTNDYENMTQEEIDRLFD